MKAKQQMKMDAESRRLIDWMVKCVHDGLQKKYLKTLSFNVCQTVEGPTIQKHTFAFSYSKSGSQDVLMNTTRSGNKKDGGTFECYSAAEITPNKMSSARAIVGTLVQLMTTQDRKPQERTILMKLLYSDDVTQADSETPLFRSCSEEEAPNAWTKNPLEMEVVAVDSKHLVLALKVKGVLLDPCKDETDDIEDNEESLGIDSMQRDDYSKSDIEVNQSQEDRYIVAPVDEQQPQKDENSMVTMVADKTPKFNEDVAYMELLSHAVRMPYVTSENLGEKVGWGLGFNPMGFGGPMARFMNKMKRDGFIEAHGTSKGGRRLGQRVIHSELKKALNITDEMDDNSMIIDEAILGTRDSEEHEQELSRLKDWLMMKGKRVMEKNLADTNDAMDMDNTEQSASKTKDHANTPKQG